MGLKLSSGFCRGMTLAEPAEVTRPTAGRVRSALWNALQLRLPGARVLDLCAGSGAVGIEALSRGADFGCFVEADRGALRALRRNLQEVERRARQQGLTKSIQVIETPLPLALSKIVPQKFDLIWMDPPFQDTLSLVESCLPGLESLLDPEGLLLIESDRQDQQALSDILQRQGMGSWFIDRQKVYGKIGVSFIKCGSEASQACMSEDNA